MDEFDAKKYIAESTAEWVKWENSRKEYEKSEEYIKNYNPIEDSWETIQFVTNLDKRYVLNIKKVLSKYDILEEHDLKKKYAPKMKNELNNQIYEKHLIISYDVEKKKAKYFVGSDEFFSKEDIEKYKPFCPCAVCKASWFSFTKYFGCSCCYGCLFTGRGIEGIPDKKNLKKASRSYRIAYPNS